MSVTRTTRLLAPDLRESSYHAATPERPKRAVRAATVRVSCALVSAMVVAALTMVSAPTAALAHTAHPSAHWTLQEPARQPSPRSVMQSMAADLADGTVVLFGGVAADGIYKDDTWTRHGTHWTEQHPAHHPSARGFAALAFDPATDTVVLFGGITGIAPNFTHFGDTWTWDGSDWTEQHPAHHPSARSTFMATDPATDSVLLQGFQGDGFQVLSDTWTWDGSDWTELHPAHHPRDGKLASDPARGTVVSFGGGSPFSQVFDETWTWDGSDWTQQYPLHHPSPRTADGLAFDPATNTVVLFGGELKPFPVVSDETWTWDGTDWTQQHPSHQPSPRRFPGLAPDPTTCSVVLFGGEGPSAQPGPSLTVLGDTWVYASSRQVPDEFDGHGAVREVKCSRTEARHGQ